MAANRERELVLHIRQRSRWADGFLAPDEDSVPLGRGLDEDSGMTASVYLATPRSGRSFVVKMQRSSGGDPAALKRMQRIFRNEYCLLERVAPRGCSPEPIAYGEVEERLVRRDSRGTAREYRFSHVAIAETYIGGERLTDAVNAYRFDFSDRGLAALAARTLGAVAVVVDRMGAAGVSHRDLKPGNIMVSLVDGADPAVHLIDFGISAENDAERTSSGVTFGSPPFSAPEKIDHDADFAGAMDDEGNRADKSIFVDVYSMGQIALCMRLVGGAFSSVSDFCVNACGDADFSKADGRKRYREQRPRYTDLSHYVPDADELPGDRALKAIIDAASRYYPYERPRPAVLAEAFGALARWYEVPEAEAVDESELVRHLRSVLAGDDAGAFEPRRPATRHPVDTSPARDELVWVYPLGGSPAKEAPAAKAPPAAEGRPAADKAAATRRPASVSRAEERSPLLEVSAPLIVPASSSPAVDDPYVGVDPNEPCPCGSGLRFKNCHGAPRLTDADLVHWFVPGMPAGPVSRYAVRRRGKADIGQLVANGARRHLASGLVSRASSFDDDGRVIVTYVPDTRPRVARPSAWNVRVAPAVPVGQLSKPVFSAPITTFPSREVSSGDISRLLSESRSVHRGTKWEGKPLIVVAPPLSRADRERVASLARDPQTGETALIVIETGDAALREDIALLSGQALLRAKFSDLMTGGYGLARIAVSNDRGRVMLQFEYTEDADGLVHGEIADAAEKRLFRVIADGDERERIERLTPMRVLAASTDNLADFIAISDFLGSDVVMGADLKAVVSIHGGARRILQELARASLRASGSI